ncbi:MAG: helix-turn-helix domain-containing protein [Fusobacterium necrophorum]|nr:helix-turn-helix domain-containing protein [Fusobacterium necrophorum]
MCNRTQKSFNQIEIDAAYDKNLIGTIFNVLHVLIEHYNEEKGFSYPSIKYMADKLECSTRTINRSIKKLKELGYITIEKMKGKAGNYNIYKNIKYMVSKTKIKKNLGEIKAKEIEEKEEIKKSKGFTVAGKLIGSNVINEEEQVTKRQSNIDDHINVRLVRAVTNVEKAPFVKTVLAMADEEVVRDSVRKFKNKRGKSATFFLSLLIDEYFRAGIRMSDKMVNLIVKGTKGNIMINQEVI